MRTLKGFALLLQSEEKQSDAVLQSGAVHLLTKRSFVPQAKRSIGWVTMHTNLATLHILFKEESALLQSGALYARATRRECVQSGAL